MSPSSTVVADLDLDLPDGAGDVRLDVGHRAAQYPPCRRNLAARRDRRRAQRGRPDRRDARRARGGAPGRPAVVADDASSDGTADGRDAPRGVRVVVPRPPARQGRNVTPRPRRPLGELDDADVLLCDADLGDSAARAGRSGRGRRGGGVRPRRRGLRAAARAAASASRSATRAGRSQELCGFDAGGADLGPARDAHSTLRGLLPFAAGCGHGDGHDHRRGAGRRSASRGDRPAAPPPGNRRIAAGFLHRAQPAPRIRAAAYALDSFPADDPRDRPGDHREHLHRLRRAGPPARPRLQRVPAALPEAGLGGARRRRDLGGDPPDRDRARWRTPPYASGPDGDRDHQPARDGRRLGPGHAASRSTAPWSGRTAAPPARCDELREQGHEALIRERTGLVIDPYFSGTKIEWLIQNAEVARWRRLRHDRLLARLQAHGPPPDRLLERLADDALRHPRARLGRGALRVARRRSEILAGAGALVGGLRHHLGLRRRGARRRHCR